MKHHGNYELLTPEELMLNAESGNKEFIYKQLNRYKQKYRNDKRHKEKRIMIWK